jgi:UPF0755 protein
VSPPTSTPRNRRAFRAALAVVLATLLALVLTGIWAGREIVRYPERARRGQGHAVTVTIGRGMKFPEVAAELQAQGVIDQPSWFRVYAMHRGLANRVRAGTYQLRDDLLPRQVLDALVAGVQEIDVAVTIPEGKHLREVFALISQAGIADAIELEAVARDPAWLKEHGIEGDTVEGYLYPDTYRFKKPTPAGKVVEAMVKRHRIVYDELARQHQKDLRRLKKAMSWGDREIVVLASIVEKETGVSGERPRVASVFYNRLTLSSFKSRRLETDPTIRYGCTIPAEKSAACSRWDPAGRLFRAQLDDVDNRYNTYQHAGLPPGPIANPGRAALEATMQPEATQYLYFVAKDDRSHVFSRTYEEHARWVEKYQK